MGKNEILRSAEDFVTRYLNARLPSWAEYHTVAHTREVVSACREIGQGMGVSGQDLEVVQLAGWFHDIGYVEGPEGHEERGVEHALAFLRANGYSEQLQTLVAQCIRATVIPHREGTVLQDVVCDADVAHIGMDDFWVMAKRLRREWELRTGEVLTDREWLTRNVKFLKTCEFRTSYGRRVLGPRREKNIAAVEAALAQLESRSSEADEQDRSNGMKDTRKQRGRKRRMEEVPKPQPETPKPPPEPPKIDLSRAAPLGVRAPLTEKGLETMFVVNARNHMSLTSMADTKANIMITTNSITLSLMVGLLLGKLPTYPFLIFPTLVLVAIALSSLIFAILSTRPRIPHGRFSHDDLRQKKVNLLFFGSYHDSPYEDFEWGMKEMMVDRDYLYSSMIATVYGMGKVLAVKYRYLRFSYNTFMYGLIAAVVSFLVAALVSGAGF